MILEHEAEIISEQNLQRANILRSISTSGVLRPRTMRESGLGFMSASEHFVQDTAQDENRVYGVLIFGPDVEDINYDERQSVVGNNTQTFVSFDNGEYERTLYGIPREETTRRVIQESLYEQYVGVIPVILERPNETKEDYIRVTEDELSERALNSLVVVADIDGVMGTNETAYIERDLLPSEIRAVICPSDLHDEIEKYFPEVYVLPVDTISKTIGLQANGDNTTKDIEVPNYELAMQVLVEKWKQPLLAHGVRFPTFSDVMGASSHQDLGSNPAVVKM